MARQKQAIRILVSGAPVSALTVGQAWVTDPVPCLHAIGFLALLKSANGDGSTLGVTTLVGQVALTRDFTTAIPVGSTVSVIAASTPSTPAFLAAGQASTWVGSASATTAPIGTPWHFFRLSGTADATNGACTSPEIELTIISDDNR